MNTAPTADDLRNKLVDAIVKTRPLPTRIEAAMRTVRRDQHVPGIDLETTYSDRAISIKDNPNGPLPLSLASVPSVVAMMLDQLDAQPGHNVLEVGAGTGYNAALLSELVGSTGHVTTVDIDPGVALYARQALNRTGYGHVTVIERDGLLGAEENGPYDRIIAAVGLWDIPPAWWTQLKDGGRLVLPLRWRGQTRSAALTRHGNTLTSDSLELCGFVPIIGQDGEHTTRLAGDTVRLHHDHDQHIDPTLLDPAFDGQATEAWSATEVASTEPFDGMWLHTTATDDRVCRIEVTTEALDAGIRRPAIPIRTPALVDGNSAAYMIFDKTKATPGHALLGAAGYGPHGADLAHQLTQYINTWGTHRDLAPSLTIHHSVSPGPMPAGGHAIRKNDTLMILTLPGSTPNGS
ncbi:methyltransferase, FxLD system [Myceligenerans pegani]|uniref:Protein-L-isoaspartate O-methyltransferase n=1 Tax=Myceligenerans pegani TaxID=2776917 RepID=A0ABR9N2M0_9MICO|nr:methyltransferase, FxLD system [Myceligenerans sp. TRM 65318]MBE1877476.1 methyltransferase, FxLD system [Myceligenerans sp. TRM 65318]MBE3019747.1 methyltransferase, FxLD system [Myceligenerans sp. TRM 65318]